MRKYVLLAGLVLAIATSAQASMILDFRVDFSNAAAVTDANWNTINTTNATNQAMVNFTTGDTSDGVTASVVSLRGTISRGTNTTNWQSSKPGPAWMDSKQNAAKDYFSQTSNSGMQVVFNGLNPSLQYTIEVISSVNSTSGYDNQNSPWRIVGATTSAATNFNSVTNGYQGGSWLSWTGVSPDLTGKLAVQVGAASGTMPNLYINAVRLYATPEPATLVLMALSLIGLRRRQ